MDNLCLFDQIWRPEAGRSGTTACPRLSGASPRPSAPLLQRLRSVVSWLEGDIDHLVLLLGCPFRYAEVVGGYSWRLEGLGMWMRSSLRNNLLTIPTTEVQPHHRPERAVSNKTLSFADH